MILTALAAFPALLGGPEVTWTAPGSWVAGGAYTVHVAITAPKEGAVVAGWLMTPAAFTVDGQALGGRQDTGTLTLPAGFTIAGDIDLGPYLQAKGDFALGYGVGEKQPLPVKRYEGAPAQLDFMTLPLEELARYQVLLQTNRGDIVVEFWPDLAPNHVRNFLDLSYTKFYDGVQFHRVSPGFMIQGGDPNTKADPVTGKPSDPASWGAGDGPRMVKAEFSTVKKHLPGVLSMARGPSPDSASSQFFIVHGTRPDLDGKYSCFGQVVTGLDVVDKIAKVAGRPIPQVGGVTPSQPQTVEHAFVIKVK